MKVLHLHKCLDISSRQALILDRDQNGLREGWQGKFTSEPPRRHPLNFLTVYWEKIIEILLICANPEKLTNCSTNSLMSVH